MSEFRAISSRISFSFNLISSFSSGRGHRRIRSPMSEDNDPNKPFALKPLLLTEIAFPEDSDSDEDDIYLNTEQPYPRSGHRIVCIGNHSIYSFGGYNPEIEDDRTLFGELWRFDLLSYRWTQELGPKDAGMPNELASMTMCASGNYILVRGARERFNYQSFIYILSFPFQIYGGSGLPFGHRNSNRLHICDTTKQPPTLREVETSGEKPLEMYGQAMIIHEDFLYVVGGTTGFDYYCDLHRLDMRTRTWEFVGPSQPNIQPHDPKGRYRHELATDKEHILVFGGGTTTCTFSLDTIPAFHVTSQRWVEYKTLPDPRTGEYPLARKYHSLVQLPDGGPVFVAGGCNNAVTLRDIWRLDLDTRTWSRLDKCRLPYRLFFHDAATTPDGCMFVFGGVRDRSGPTRTNNLYKLWLQVPALRAISAEAVRYWLRVCPAATSEEEEEEDQVVETTSSGSVAKSFNALPSHCRKYLL